MKIVKSLWNVYSKFLKLIIILFSLFSITIHNVKISSSFELLTLNLALQKVLLSQDDFQVINIRNKYHKLSTESLFLDKNNNIYESGKINNINVLIKKHYPSNNILKAVPVGNFSIKGFTKCANTFYQVTGSNKKIFKYSITNLDILTPISSDPELGDAEGLANLSDDYLLGTNGSNKIFVLDCKNDLNIIKTIYVQDYKDDDVIGLLDLIAVGEFIYAVQGNSNRIIKINPKTGRVVKFYNLISLLDFELKSKSLNLQEINKGASISGIAYDEKRKIFIITGRYWLHYFEVVLR